MKFKLLNDRQRILGVIKNAFLHIHKHSKIAFERSILKQKKELGYTFILRELQKKHCFITDLTYTLKNALFYLFLPTNLKQSLNS